MSIPWRHDFDRNIPDAAALCEAMRRDPSSCRGAAGYLLSEYDRLRANHIAALNHIERLEQRLAALEVDDFPTRFPYQDAPNPTPSRPLEGVPT